MAVGDFGRMAMIAERWHIPRVYQFFLVAGLMVLTAALPWFVPPSDVEAHNVLHHLNFIPLMLAGLLYGWRGAVLIMAAASLGHYPYLHHTWASAPSDARDQVIELCIFGAAGVVAGLLSDRERAQRLKAERTSAQLESVYRELQQNVDKMRKAERLYAAGQLSASLAHEIRNPLVGISGAAGILKRGNASAGNQAECLEIIDKESRRLSKLLTGFLDFARPRAPRMHLIDLSGLVQSVIPLAAHVCEQNQVSIQFANTGELPKVECDPEQIKQVLLNLVINAAEASPAGSVVELSAESVHDRTLVNVRDQGCGIKPEEEGQIFDPFYTTKEKGTGLGLAIASMIMSQHGGQLTWTRNSGPGMTFRLELPLVRADASSEGHSKERVGGGNR